MKDKTFEKFIEYAKQFGYRVYKTSPETALVVGNFEIEEPIAEPKNDPNAYEQVSTGVYELRNGLVKCATCGYVFYLTEVQTKCPHCFREVDRIIEDPNIKYGNPDYTNQIKTTQLIDVENNVKQCAVCGYTYNGTPRSISCIGCGKMFAKENDNAE